MEDFADLERRLDAKLAAAEERGRLHQNHLQQRMADLDERHRRFKEVADGVIQDIIRPRMEKLSGRFDNAEMVPPERGTRNHSVCRFRQ
jgi:hypothetical protein